jgi:Zn-dependent protease with chaperone function
MTLPNILGIAGSAIVIIAYFAVARGSIATDSRPYYLANLFGAVLIFISLWWAWNLPAAIVEVFWAAISAYGLLRAAISRSQSRPQSP